MTKERIKRIHLIYRILLSIAIVIAGVCLMAACVSIYRSGDEPFSRSAVANAFSYIAVPVYLCLALTAIGFILDLFLPDKTAKPSAGKQYALILRNLQNKTDLNECGDSVRKAVRAQHRSRVFHKSVTIILLLIGCVIFLIYALNSNNFHPSEINASMIKAMYVLLPCVAVPFAYAVFSAFYCKNSIRKEIDLLKQAKPSGAPRVRKVEPKNHDKPLLILRCAFLIAGLALLLYGFFNDGTADVLTKAINICTECVGLG